MFEHFSRAVVDGIQATLVDPARFHQQLAEQLADAVRAIRPGVGNESVVAVARELARLGFLRESENGLFSLSNDQLARARASSWFDNVTLHLSVTSTEKKLTLLAARKLRLHLESLGIRILSGEYIRNDGSAYVEVPLDAEVPDEASLRKQLPELMGIARDLHAAFPKVDACLNCGNIPEAPFAVCPNCAFREITSCPSCRKEVPRLRYAAAGGDLFQCPECQSRVRLAYNEPLWRDDGHYNEPTVIVTLASKDGV